MSLEALEDASAVRDDEGGKEPAGGEANPGDAPAMNGGAAAVARATEAGGAPVVAPRTVGELSNLIARASRDGRQVRFIGNATSPPRRLPGPTGGPGGKHARAGHGSRVRPSRPDPHCGRRGLPRPTGTGHRRPGPVAPPRPARAGPAQPWRRAGEWGVRTAAREVRHPPRPRPRPDAGDRGRGACSSWAAAWSRTSPATTW